MKARSPYQGACEVFCLGCLPAAWESRMTASAPSAASSEPIVDSGQGRSFRFGSHGGRCTVSVPLFSRGRPWCHCSQSRSSAPSRESRQAGDDTFMSPGRFLTSRQSGTLHVLTFPSQPPERSCGPVRYPCKAPKGCGKPVRARNEATIVQVPDAQGGIAAGTGKAGTSGAGGHCPDPGGIHVDHPGRVHIPVLVNPGKIV